MSVARPGACPGPMCTTSVARRVRHPALRAWLTRPACVLPCEAALSLAHLIDAALTERTRRLDLSRASPAAVAALPSALIGRLSAQTDHLLLPPGCSQSTVLRWLAHLNVETLTAHDVKLAGGVADAALPSRLAIIHGNTALLHPQDLHSTRRLIDLSEPESWRAAAPSDDRADQNALARALFDPTASLGRIQELHDAWRVAQACEQRVHGQTIATLDAAGTRLLRTQLARWPTALISPQGRAAMRLVQEWLDVAHAPQLTALRCRQLTIAMTDVVECFVVEREHASRLATAPELRALADSRAQVAQARTSAERAARQATLRRTLRQRSGLDRQPNWTLTRLPRPDAAPMPAVEAALEVLRPVHLALASLPVHEPAPRWRLGAAEAALLLLAVKDSDPTRGSEQEQADLLTGTRALLRQRADGGRELTGQESAALMRALSRLKAAVAPHAVGADVA